MDEDEVESKLSDCENVRNVERSAGGPGYSEWALSFLESIREQFDDDVKLSAAQLTKLQELWDDI